MVAVRHLGRRFLRSPGFCVLVIATVALGIGINLGFFSVAYAVLRQGLPVPNPDQLILYSTRRAGATNLSGPVFDALRKFGLQTQLLAWARTPLKIRSAERM